MLATLSLLEGLETNEQCQRRKRLQQHLQQQQQPYQQQSYQQQPYQQSYQQQSYQQQQQPTYVQQQQQQQQQTLPDQQVPYYYYYYYPKANNNNNNNVNNNQQQQQQQQQRRVNVFSRLGNTIVSSLQSFFTRELLGYRMNPWFGSSLSTSTSMSNASSSNNNYNNYNTSSSSTTSSIDDDDSMRMSGTKEADAATTSSSSNTIANANVTVMELSSKIVELEEMVNTETHYRDVERKGRLIAEQGLQEEINHMGFLSKKYKDLETQHDHLWRLYGVCNKRKKALQQSCEEINGQLQSILDQFQQNMAEQMDASNNQTVTVTIDSEFIEAFERLTKMLSQSGPASDTEDPLQQQEEELFLHITKHSNGNGNGSGNSNGSSNGNNSSNSDHNHHHHISNGASSILRQPVQFTDI
ncbi:hypothetical protein SAMD00019534_057110 [Acytostelium subglobosum LB1]|uniref:hypothetical protein n=1 Tax=Acytostelium subglobosum LB1 TaxID=1410327 RepID=UPI000645237F|nr:hypothetical protein SAMD00019534_057110 [Acytostelium subglobosum LB1]GAM22536.1 hypothetical protein SAMD00019534_057110 [Acytostelium subglobosum LB1]|eukprot:XP_012754656.1 hypothetical protein SAMD00019534_057110 [Acytostelium subglobosum LB1]